MIAFFLYAFTILKWLPGLPSPLAVELALPNDYEVRAVDEKKPTLFSEVVLADKEQINWITKHPEDIRYPFIAATLSMGVSQSGSDCFSIEENLEAEAKKGGLKDLHIEKFSWGNYPVLSMKALHSLSGRQVYFAWVGLNSFPSGYVVSFKFFYPHSEKEPNLDELAIWTRFLKETEALSQEEALHLCGFDMQADYTIYSKEGVEIKVMAKKRENEVVIDAKPKDENIEFEIISVKEGEEMGMPCFKVTGDIFSKEITRVTIPVFFKTIGD